MTVLFAAVSPPLQARMYIQPESSYKERKLLRTFMERHKVSQSITTQSTVQASSSGSFYTYKGQIYDANNQPFIMRGVNNPHAYYYDDSLNALENIKSLGFNTVRVVWCASNFTYSTSACKQQYHFHSVAQLETILAEMRRLDLVAVLDIQNITGSMSADELQMAVDYFVDNPQMISLLNAYKERLIINIANEWYGKWRKYNEGWSSALGQYDLSNPDYPVGMYQKTYLDVIKRFEQAALPHLLVIDAGGYGQDFSFIEHYADEILQTPGGGQRSNVAFSSHMYSQYTETAQVQHALDFVRENEIPWIIGEFGGEYRKQKWDPDSGQNVVVTYNIAYPTIIEQPPSLNLSKPENNQVRYGYIAWSYSGNGHDNFNNLDLTYRDDNLPLGIFGWQSLTDWGLKLMAEIGRVARQVSQ